MGAGLAAGSFFLGGQMQGRAMAQQYQQQVELRQMEEILKRQLLMGQIQDMQEYKAARSRLPQNQQDALTLGETYDQIQKGNDKASRAKALATQLTGMASSGNYTPEQKMALYRHALGLMQNPETVDDVDKLMKAEGFGQKPAKQDFKTFEMGRSKYAFEGYGPDGKPIMQEIGPAAESKTLDQPPKPNIDTESEGTSLNRVARDPRTGAILWTSPAGTAKPSATTLQSIAESRKTAGVLKAIPDLLNKIDINDRGKLINQYWLYTMSPTARALAEKVYGSLDPNYSMLFSQLGQAQAGLSRSYMGGRPSQQLFEKLSSHMPQPGDPPELVADKVRSLLGPNGVLQQNEKTVDQMYHLTPDSADYGESSDKQIGYAPDGRTVYQRPDGSKYAK